MVDFAKYIKNSSLLEGTSPIPSVRGSSETQDREEPPALQESLSVAALKANLFFYSVKKQTAFEAHKQAIIDEHIAMTALTNALRRLY